jgi:hypothetical protein
MVQLLLKEAMSPGNESKIETDKAYSSDPLPQLDRKRHPKSPSKWRRFLHSFTRSN